MKVIQKIRSLVLVVLSVIFVAGCVEPLEQEQPKPGPSKPQETEQKPIRAPQLSVKLINFEQEVGTATLEVLADTTWKAFCGAADDWNHGVSISPDNGQKGSTTVTITASDKKVELDNFVIVFYNYLPAQGEQSHLHINKKGTDKKVVEALSEWLAPGGTCETEMINGRISTLKMYNVNGRAPQILSELDSLKWLEIIDWKGHESDFVFFKDFSILESLYMTLYGVNEIPKELLTLTQLKRLCFVSNDTPLPGSIPEEFRYFPDLEYLVIGPGLSGPIPEWVLSSRFWPNSQHYLMTQNDFDPLFPSFTITDYRSGKEYNLAEEITSHKYTMLVTYNHRTDEGEIGGFSRALAPYIEQMYQAYKDEGLQVIGFPEMMVNVNYGPFALASYPTTVYLEPDGTDGQTLLEGFGKEYNDYNPDMTILDSNGNICVSTNVMTGLSAAADFLKEKFGHGFLYESTDYSRDGEVRLVQKAAKGKGIDLVFIGNCFSDRKIADGTFDKVMNAAVNAFFYEDPMYSMRDLFNVYIITTVSPNEYYGPGTKSAIDVSFPGGSCYSPSASISVNLQQVYDYASDVASNDGRFVVVNYMPMRKGSCAMSFKEGGKYSEGGFTAFCAARYGVEMIEILTHEACGHGIGKLADEYVYASLVTPTWCAFDEATLKDFQERGYYTNYSRTSDPEKVPWARFLKDSRYTLEELGVYSVGEGFGYRSSRYDVMGMGSMMDEHLPFSAPNRYTLWRAISYLAYGDGFKDDFEEFVEMDAEVRKFRSDWIAGLNSRWYHAFDPKPDSWFETLTFDLVP